LNEALRKFLDITGDASLSRYLARHGQSIAERVAWAQTADNDEATYLRAHAEELLTEIDDSPALPGFAPDEPLGNLTTMDCITRPVAIPIELRAEGVVEPRLRERPPIVPVRVHEDNDDDLDELMDFAYEEGRTRQLARAERPADAADTPDTADRPDVPDIAPATAPRQPPWAAVALAALAVAAAAILILR